MNSANAERSRVWMEARRLRAWELVQKGWKQTDVAEALGVTRGAVSQWVAQARQGGTQALRRRKPPGGRRKLSDVKLAQLPQLLSRGPSAFGLRVLRGHLDQGTDCSSDPAGIRSFLRPFPGGADSQGMRLQSAKTGTARLPAERGGHKGLAGPALRRAQKKAVAEGRTILWADESGFYLLPALHRTWAPAGRTPVIRHKLSRERLSAVSAISMTGELYLAAQDHSCEGADLIRFLEQLLEEIPGKLLVIRDGAPIHRSRAVRSRAVKEWLGQGAARSIRLEQLPGYAPELNPDEGVWRYLKRVELRNVVCADLEQLGREFWAAVRRLLSKPYVLRSCIREVGYV